VYGRFARLYDVLDFPFELLWYRRWRRDLLAGTHGLVLDIGAGTGKNIDFLGGAAAVVSLDLSPSMLRAGKAIRGNSNCSLIVADVAALPFANQTFDTVVATFICCVLDDPTAALHEIARALAPDGNALMLEFVSTRRWHTVLGALVRLLHRIYGVRVGAATSDYMTGTDLTIKRSERRLGGAFVLLWVTHRHASAASAPGTQGEC
jgi:ubiquinone/menaquinone biosynthesis C-methylase UbiE